MANISKATLQAYREQTFGLLPTLKLKHIEDAATFVKKRGFVYFWPIKGITLPSLWAGVAGDRPVADAHDDPGHVTWGWKDAALGKHIWYYGKILRKKATLIDLDVAPYFYALSENYGDPEEDVLIAYQEGRLTLEAKFIFEVLTDNGPMDTIAIRRATHLTSKESNTRFERALAQLQADFKILPVGISDAGSWRYAFIYDLVHRHYPELPERAREISEREARRKLVELYFLSIGAAQLRDLSKLFGWRVNEIEIVLYDLCKNGILVGNLEFEDQIGEWFCLRALV
ncbi:MAG TPA: hypothetical protein DEH22_00085 [Chloroflexi bacterium]|nr:hypothetical protein [Chloroflexota bacterium]